ncbi:hypothetical protein CDAR_547161 [Caerostris darwini]|uniref:Uncharacterized protein n=1 Tax=Caerostris darwini TaxID=1538125 RepID=A0AAV4PTQ8_9ARAC|nr:hypothetical protein CDAR_547161 [Caerostris darwini]
MGTEGDEEAQLGTPVLGIAGVMILMLGLCHVAVLRGSSFRIKYSHVLVRSLCLAAESFLRQLLLNTYEDSKDDFSDEDTYI